MNSIKNIIQSKRNNFFLILGVIFFIWMLFFDSANLLTLFRLLKKYRNLNSEKEYYETNIQKLTKYKNALENDKEMLEKIAREKYFMKKPDEQIILVD